MSAPAPATDALSRLQIARDSQGAIRVRLSGRWTLADGLPSTDSVARELESAPAGTRLVFEAAGLETWDSALVSFLFSAAGLAAARGSAVDTSALPEGAR
ncbi:MAG TPA: STAS domain-containing protein, partial [Vicinamibacteria bacterium]|nr:STAS domain-containing protein [Vicinamibacteria bacterium]